MTTKNATGANSENFQVDKQSSAGAAFARLYWMLLGNIILICIAIAIYKGRNIFSRLDIFYLFIVLSLAYIRYFDIKHCGGLTSTGEPATISDWRRYSLFLATIALTVLVVVHLPGLVGKKLF